ncbi:hypothetical protein HYS50_03340 [Candidatus Woesearchaeota archaeon]|nr:hypothetical protein [Candidatus Woesearchaeota archaeon]
MTINDAAANIVELKKFALAQAVELYRNHRSYDNSEKVILAAQKFYDEFLSHDENNGFGCLSFKEEKGE